jgi:phage host-nuclease inhibitor protein Gam
LPVSKETWKRLRARQRESREFKTRKAMGEWAAELLMALPPQASKLNADAKAELFKRIDEWCRARGLR